MKTKVLVADDQELFRDGVGMLIESQSDLELVGSVGTGRDAVERVETMRPDVVLMDIRMPGLDGLAATELILASGRDPLPRVLVVTTFRRDEAVVRAIRAGASGFVTKDADPEFLLAAIRTVAAGNSVIAPAATFDLLRQFGNSRPGPDASVIDELSPREKEIFLLVAKGLSNAEVAESAFVEETTVKTHLGKILSKLGLRSRVQVVAFAWQHGLVG
ncbi:response regulator [Lysinimonas soli]|uniref:Response regulator n=1 Tax=Lysinimonas soli TaxID=1074233 RepID=A0ABW0NMB3_9MICO